MSLKVLKPGLYVTIQDKGRLGFQDKGIPKSGFMDVKSANLANMLVNNKPGDSLIEMGLLGATFKVLKDINIAVCGAEMNAKIDDELIETNKLFFVKKGSVLKFSNATNGIYTYLAISGGLKLNKYLGSTATYIPAEIGGLKGQILKKNDVINTYISKRVLSNSKIKKTPFKNQIILTCLKGPEYHQFPDKALELFKTTQYVVSKDCNRIGIRLEGSPLTFANKSEIISSGIVKGTIQITKGGLPIIMMSDAPTTGGYMRIANLTVDACNKLSQVAVGGIVKFKFCNH